MSSAKQTIVIAVAGAAFALWITAVTRSFASVCPGPPGSQPGYSAIVATNLLQIGTALYTYTNEYPVRFPPHLSMIYPQYVANPSMFWHPGDTDPCPTTIDNDIPNSVNSAEISFHYFGGTADDPASIVLEDSTLSYNSGLGIHVLLSDLRALYLTPTVTPPVTATAGRNNLELIALALNAYANEHMGHFPPLLSSLYPTYISNPLVFWNPGDNLGGNNPALTTINNDLPNKPNSAQYSFAYSGAGHSITDDPGVVLVQDNSLINNGGVVLNIRTIGAPAASYLHNPACENISACRMLARQNLKQIALAMSSYASSNRDSYPTQLSMLYRDHGYLYDPTAFWNPGDSNPRPLFIDSDVPESDNSTQISYAYFGGKQTSNGTALVLQDGDLANNNGDGLFVVTADTAVDFFVRSNQTLPDTTTARAHLQQISTALHAYANANGGQFPLHLSQLFPTYVSDPTVFWNPGDAQAPPSTINNDNVDKPNSAQISFHYRGFAYTSASSPGVVLVEDNALANNSGVGVLVLTADGTIDFYVPQPHPCPSPNSCIPQAVSKLHELGMRLWMYSNENSGMLPPTLSSFYPQYLNRPTDFWDPADSDPAPTTINNDVPDATNSAQISIRYLGAGLNIDQLPGSTVLLRDSTIADAGGDVILEYRAIGFVQYVPIRTLTHITISGPEVVPQGKTAHFTCIGTYSDATTRDITTSSWWSVSSGQGAFVENSLYQAPPSAAGGLPVTVQVAAFSYGGSEKVATKTIAIVTDSDCDSVPDSADLCPNTVPGAGVDSSGCPPIIFGDADHDGDVDVTDQSAFTACRSNAGVAASLSCVSFDRNGDGDVDMEDFGAFQRCYSGANVAADPACDD